MPSLKFLARRLTDRTFGTAFDRGLARARSDPRNRFLFFWNRGLGDIALGLVPLFLRIRAEAPGARIEVITRDELRAPFELTAVDAIHSVPGLRREARIDIAGACESLGIDVREFAVVFDYPDPNRWLAGRRSEYPSRLAWNPAWDVLADRFATIPSKGRVIGAHVNSETARHYGYLKDWPAEAWQALFARFADLADVHWVLFGRGTEPRIAGERVTDLRGQTSFPELMSVIKNRCGALVAPDSGVLTMTYYLDAAFPLDVISLWSDPRQGILLQDCPSPNPLLRHTPLLSPAEDVRNLPVDAVDAALRKTGDRPLVPR